MKITQLLLLLLFLFSLSSCNIRGNKGWYDSTQSEYDKNKAFESINNLKNGVLLVVLPQEKHKHKILKDLVNSKPSEKNEKKLYQFERDIKLARSRLKYAVENLYSFSKYYFIEQSDIKEFKKSKKISLLQGSRSDDFSVFNDDSLYFLSYIRNYDFLHIKTFDGKFPCRPFPYTSQEKTKQALVRDEYHSTVPVDKRNNTTESVFILQRKLALFN